MKNYTAKSILSLFLLLGIIASSIAQKEVTYDGFSVQNSTIKIQISTGNYLITPFSEKIIQTQFIPNNSTDIYHSFAVNSKLLSADLKVIEKDNLIHISTKGIKIKIVKQPFSISYFYKDEKLLTEDKTCSITDSLRSFYFAIAKEEKLYGTGSRVLGLDRRGHKLPLYNRAHYGFETYSEQMNFSLPVVISSKKYALLFDNPAKGFIDLDSKANNSLTYEAVGGAMNYYVVAADDWYDLVDEYTGLTGRQPLPPRWAFGNFASRFGYHSQSEVLETAHQFVKDSIPLEAIILDIYWFGKEVMGTMGNLAWHTDSFPNPQEMIKDLQSIGVKPILISEPFILTTSKRWEEAVENKVLATTKEGKPYTYDFFFGNTGLIDVFDETARHWYWNIYKNLANQGIEGVWGDLGEPEVHPSDLQHKLGSADELHNAYGHKWAELIWEGYRNDFSDKRAFILMRAGFAGSQRFGMIPWTGDVSRSWGGLVSQPEISLGMGMQGIAYMHSDLGGFAGDHPLDNELYIRWLQYGVFQPIYRPHAQEAVSPEQVFQNDTTKAIVKNAIELRYRLLPYIYNMAFQNSQTGKPLMIPLFFNESDNEKLMTYDAAYMWGDAFLVSPIKASGVKKQSLYLPKGSAWFDFYTEEKFEGGQEISTKVTIKHIPTFVKGGSFIPMKKEVVNTEHYNLQEFVMHYYLDDNVKSSEYKLYNDDGKLAQAFEKGNYEMLTFRAENKHKSMQFSITSAKAKHIEFILHNVENEPKSIYFNKEKMKGNYNSELKTFSFTILAEEKSSLKLKF